MANISQLLKSFAKAQKIGLEIVLKDYAISYLLSAIAQTPGLGEKLVLKGRTALKKLYYLGYRFSEDMDCSTLKLGVITGADELLQTAATRMVALLQERGPFDSQIEPLTLRLPHPGKQMAYTVRIRFPDQRQALCRLRSRLWWTNPYY